MFQKENETEDAKRKQIEKEIEKEKQKESDIATEITTQKKEIINEIHSIKKLSSEWKIN